MPHWVCKANADYLFYATVVFLQEHLLGQRSALGATGAIVPAVTVGAGFE